MVELDWAHIVSTVDSLSTDEKAPHNLIHFRKNKPYIIRCNYCLSDLTGEIFIFSVSTVINTTINIIIPF